MRPALPLHWLDPEGFPSPAMRDVFARALYAEWRARQDISRRACIEDRWREVQAQGLDRPWLTKAEQVLTWAAVFGTPAPEEQQP